MHYESTEINYFLSACLICYEFLFSLFYFLVAAFISSTSITLVKEAAFIDSNFGSQA